MQDVTEKSVKTTYKQRSTLYGPPSPPLNIRLSQVSSYARSESCPLSLCSHACTQFSGMIKAFTWVMVSSYSQGYSILPFSRNLLSPDRSGKTGAIVPIPPCEFVVTSRFRLDFPPLCRTSLVSMASTLRSSSRNPLRLTLDDAQQSALRSCLDSRSG